MAAGHRPATPYAHKVDTKEERRDSCPATEEEGCGQIEQLAKELEMPSAILTDRQGWGGRSGQGFHCANMKPLLDRTAHRTWSNKESFGDPLRQPDRPSLTLYHPYPSPLLGRLPQPQHQGSRYLISDLLRCPETPKTEEELLPLPAEKEVEETSRISYQRKVGSILFAAILTTSQG